MAVRLPAGFTDAHKVIARRFIQAERFAQFEQALLLEAFDLLHQGQITTPIGWRSFATVYEQFVETRFANEYLQALIQSSDIAIVAESLRAGVSSQILPFLKKVNLLEAEEPLSFYFLAYCLYWWYVFAKGYAFEISVFRDLDRAGVRYTAHDLLDAKARRSTDDLVVLGLGGDIKASIYFLHSVRTAHLSHDFYITQVFRPHKNQLIWLVFLQERVWNTLSETETSTVFATLETLGALLLGIFRFRSNNITLTVVDYPTWKNRVLKAQERSTQHD